MGRGMFSGGQPRHCICRNASRGLSATAEFLVPILLIALQQSLPNAAETVNFPYRPIRDVGIMANL